MELDFEIDEYMLLSATLTWSYRDVSTDLLRRILSAKQEQRMISVNLSDRRKAVQFIGMAKVTHIDALNKKQALMMFEHGAHVLYLN